MDDLKKLRFLIVGASGLIGRNYFDFLSSQGEDVVGTYFSDEYPDLVRLDITDAEKVDSFFGKQGFDVVIFPAANPNVEWCESHPEDSHKVNVAAVKNVIDICRKKGMEFVFFSSEYVFDGADGPYTEEDSPNPISVYGRHKLEVEEYMSANLQDYLILRTTVVFGSEKKRKNFVYKILDNLSKGRSVEVPDDQVSSPTYANSMVECTYRLIRRGKKGIFNAVGSSIMDRFKFSHVIADVFGLDKS